MSSIPTTPKSQSQSRGKPRVLFIGDYSGIPSLDAEIRELAEVVCMPRMGYEETAKMIADAVAQGREEGKDDFVAFGGLFLIHHKFPPLWDAPLLSPLLPSCRLFVGPGAGYDKVDIPYLTSAGAMYANSPTAVGRRTADGGLALVLAMMRGVVRYDTGVRAGGWIDRGVKTIDWRTSKIGFIGLGTIGTRLASLLTSIGASSISYHSRRPSTSPLLSSSWAYLPLSTLLSESDVIILTCPLTPETKRLIGRGAFAQMKDGVCLVNIARGEVVVEDALVEALESGKVMRAALDVFENEPHVHPGLLKNPNVILSPHVGPAPDSMGAILNGEILENIISFLRTGMPLTPVNVAALKEAGYGDTFGEKIWV